MKDHGRRLFRAAGIIVLWLTTAACMQGQLPGGSGLGTTGGPAMGGTFGGFGTTGGTGSSFLGTGGGVGGGGFLDVGYGQGQLGHVARAGRSTTASTGNPFSRFYVNTYGLGMPVTGTTTATSTAFGVPLYNSLYPGTTPTAPTGAAGALGTGAARISSSFVPATTGLGLTGGYRRPASYTTSVGFRYRPTNVAQLRSDLQQVLARSTDLAGNGTLQIVIEDQVVVLRGTVADAEQRRLAENLVRLSPGVRGVRNELVIEERLPSPKLLP